MFSRHLLSSSLLGKRFLYCGFKVPWSIIFFESHCDVTLNQLDKISYGFFFILLYEATDTKALLLNVIFFIITQDGHLMEQRPYNLYHLKMITHKHHG